MQTPVIQTRMIAELVQEIKYLSSENLELIGNKLISIIENTNLIHRGLTIDHKPCAYTVDSFSDDSTIIAEYSTEVKYFNAVNGIYPKIQADIKHMLDHTAPFRPKKIYLVSNQEEPPSFRSKINKIEIYQENAEIIHFLSARDLAEEIYKQSISSPGCFLFYSTFFPTFAQLMDNYEYYGKLPALCEKYISEPKILDAISRHFKQENRICVLHGLSGSGKTQAAIDFVHRNKESFSNYIWINGSDWIPNTSLSSIRRARGGAPVNVAGLFNGSKTILVVDSIERVLDESHFRELKAGFEKGGIVLATSQCANVGDLSYLSIPQLSPEVAYQILEEDVSAPTELASKVVNLCCSFPLVLSTIRRLIKQANLPRRDLYEAVLQSPDEVLIDDGTAIMRRILEKLDEKSIAGIRKIANTGTTSFDLQFVREFVTLLTCHKLQQLSILMPTDIPGIVKVHDLICAAMQNNCNCIEISRAMEKYIEKNNGEMTPSVLRQIHLCQNQIKNYVKSQEKSKLSWLTYALLQIEGDDKYTISDRIYSKKIGYDMPLCEMLCIIEAKELYAYKLTDRKAQQDFYQECAIEYQCASQKVLSKKAKTELMHHSGKAYRRCSQYEEAHECFQGLLSSENGRHAAQGQIVFLGAIKKSSDGVKASGERCICELFSNISQDPYSIPLRVSLAAIAKLTSYRNVCQKIDEKTVDGLSKVIAMSALDGIGQFYEAFVSFTSCFSYIYSAKCVQLAEDLLDMLTTPPMHISEEYWVSACEVLTNLSTSAKAENKSTLSDLLLAASIDFAREISAVRNSPFDMRAAAKAFNAGLLFNDAMKAIERVPEERIDHWLLYRKTETQLGLGIPKDACETMKKAIELAENDPKAKPRLAAYYHLLGKCYKEANNVTCAAKQVEYAISICESAKYKEELFRYKEELQ